MVDDKQQPAVLAPEDRERILRCARCGKTIGCSPVEMLAYTVSGWPRCCGETMTLSIEAKLTRGAAS